MTESCQIVTPFPAQNRKSLFTIRENMQFLYFRRTIPQLVEKVILERDCSNSWRRKRGFQSNSRTPSSWSLTSAPAFVAQ